MERWDKKDFYLGQQLTTIFDKLITSKQNHEISQNNVKSKAADEKRKRTKKNIKKNIKADCSSWLSFLEPLLKRKKRKPRIT